MKPGERDALALGFVLGRALGDPSYGHPVGGFGVLATALERRTWRSHRRAGIARVALLLAVVAWISRLAAFTAIQMCLPDRQTLARVAADVATAREDVLRRLAEIPGVKTWSAQANFVLIEVSGGERVIARLAAKGIAARPCDSFPGLGTDHVRLAVRTPAEHAVLAAAITRALDRSGPLPPVSEPDLRLLRS
jgi:hypothetical protein